MQIRLTLYGLFREKLPKDTREKAQIDVLAGSTIADVLTRQGIEDAVCSINGELEYDRKYVLQEGDQLQVFRSTVGG